MWLNRKILVATDFGELAEAVCNVGLELARRFQVPLVVMHTYAPMAPNYSGAPLLPPAQYREIVENAARATLEQEAARLRGKGVDISTVLQVGVPAEEVLRTANALDVGLIVMGTHGRHGLPRALLGSVAEKVVRMSPIPVLTLHEPLSQTEEAQRK
jgi:nucleotide-binding universal stress UspA family protein